MKLYEFFGNINHDVDRDKEKDSFSLGKEEQQELSDQLFWYILDHDELHKKHFLPTAKQIKNSHKEDKKEGHHDWKMWLPMVNKGCKHFYKDHQVKGDPKEIFNKKLRIDLCKRLVDHFHKDIIKGEYKLGH